MFSIQMNLRKNRNDSPSSYGLKHCMLRKSTRCDIRWNRRTSNRKNWSICSVFCLTELDSYFHMIFCWYGTRKRKSFAGDYFSTFLTCVFLTTVFHSIFSIIILFKRFVSTVKCFFAMQFARNRTNLFIKYQIFGNSFLFFELIKLKIDNVHFLAHFSRISAPFCKFSSFLKKQNRTKFSIIVL